VRFFLFLWDFVVGDDWRAAVGLALAIGAAAAIVAAGVNDWWLLPPAVGLVLYESLRREIKRAERSA
jgi:hypothetical protein